METYEDPNQYENEKNEISVIYTEIITYIIKILKWRSIHKDNMNGKYFSGNSLVRFIHIFACLTSIFGILI